MHFVTTLILSSLFAFTASAQSDANSVALKRYQEIANGAPQSKSGLSSQEMTRVLSHVITHPIATILDPQTTFKYDPQGLIGFCFGRSMAVHLAARKIGLAHKSIRKLFIIGDMRSGPEPEWRFHVTTVVRGSDGNWYALDPIAASGSVPRVMTMAQWSQWVRSIWDRPLPGKKHFTKIYMVDPNFIIPNLLRVPDAGIENQVDIMSTTFNPSTKDLYRSLDRRVRDFYQVKQSEQTKQFIGVQERGQQQFDFANISVNNSDPFTYSGYFHDLLEVFSKTTANHILKGAAEKSLMQRESIQTMRATNKSVRQRNGLGSMRFGR